MSRTFGMVQRIDHDRQTDFPARRDEPLVGTAPVLQVETIALLNEQHLLMLDQLPDQQLQFIVAFLNALQ